MSAVSPSSLHTMPAPCSSSQESLLTALPYSQGASPPQETVLHECFQLTGRSAAWISSPRAKPTRHQSFSDSRPFSGILVLCHTGLSRAVCNMVLSPALCSTDLSPALCGMVVSPLLFSDYCRVSVCQLTTGQRETALLVCLPSHLPSTLNDNTVDDCMVISPSTPKLFPKQVPL